jgi:hypothetical protein
MTATLTPPIALPVIAAEKTKTYVRYLRIKMEEDQAKQWDELSRDEIDELSAPYRTEVIEDFEKLLALKAERVAAQTELLDSLPDDVKARAQKLGLVLTLTAG